MTERQVPGVYINEISSLPGTVTAASTTVVAFIGYTEKATGAQGEDLHSLATPIRSMLEFEQCFGGPAPALNCQLQLDTSTGLANVQQWTPARFYLHAALQLYFANGGGACIIVSVGDFTAAAPQLQPLLTGLAACAQANVSLLVCPEACTLPIADYQQWTAAALAQCAALRDRFAILDMHGGTCPLDQANSDMAKAAAEFRADACPQAHLRHGAVYTPHVLTTLMPFVDPANTVVHLQQPKGTTMTTSLDMLQHKFPRQYRACMTALGKLTYPLPPSAAIAGAYVTTDNQRGVWKAPANLSLNAVSQPCIQMDDETQTGLNIDTSTGKSINAIRQFIGKGTLIWGARTLAGNDNEWRYVPVRRLAIFLETSIARSLQTWTFEANDADCWLNVQAMLENFMTGLWRQGALQGNKPEQGFFVRVGLGKTMNSQDIQEGRMRVELGFAPLTPAEFILLRFTVNMNSINQ